LKTGYRTQILPRRSGGRWQCCCLDLLAFATRDWRAAVAGACLSVVMIVLSLRVSRGDLQER
jgi:hypothetical protein